MCRQTQFASTTTATTTTKELVVSDSLLFRHFEPQDLPRVKEVFANGMRSLIQPMIRVLTRRRLLEPSILHPLVVAAVPTGLCLWLGLLDDDNNDIDDDSSTRVASSTYMGFVLLVSLSWHLYYRVVSRQKFEAYIQEAFTTDLASVKSTYFSKGGAFVVAVSRADNRVVGVVGGQFKHQTLDGHHVYELRRMSVDSQMRGGGIGGRLVQYLESELQNMSQLFLYCSNVQDPARRMYHRVGFQITDRSTYRDWPKGFEAFRFEKHYHKED